VPEARHHPGWRPSRVKHLYKEQKTLGEKIGAIVSHEKFPETASQGDVLSAISKHNADSTVHGIIVQLPLPTGFNESEIIEAIDPSKDVDGMTSKNVKALYEGSGGAKNPNGSSVGFVPATTKGIILLLEQYNINPVGKKVVVVGHSVLVGKPTALAMLNLGATVTVCHSQTQNLAEETRQADILIVAVGKPGFIGREYVKPGQVVIDIGITVVEVPGAGVDEPAKKKIQGDIDFESVKEIVAAITPVPGGVGPMTIVSLFENLLMAGKR
jgi:methylenetetrahydrofolate dehydrogenase (NADP+)/methenyltetrahydrofolate cyclohydrolase